MHTNLVNMPFPMRSFLDALFCRSWSTAGPETHLCQPRAPTRPKQERHRRPRDVRQRRRHRRLVTLVAMVTYDWRPRNRHTRLIDSALSWCAAMRETFRSVMLLPLKRRNFYFFSVFHRGSKKYLCCTKNLYAVGVQHNALSVLMVRLSSRVVSFFFCFAVLFFVCR